MFGSNDNSSLPNDPAMLDNVKHLASQPADQVVPPATPAADDGSAPVPPSAPSTTATDVPAPAPVQDPAPTQPAGFTMDAQAPAPAAPLDPTSPAPADPPQNTQPVAPDPQPAPEPSQSGFDPLQSDGASVSAAPASQPVAMPDPVQQPANPIVADIDEHLTRLSDLKQKAMDELEPLSGHLESTPEETFKMTMMMIQANDNHHLLEKALEAAQGIKDDRARAQAMLEVINEINYFSQVTPLDQPGQPAL